MKRRVEMFEVSFHHHMLLFSAQADAVAAVSALSRGAYMTAACNPLDPQARVDLAPIEPRLRRVFIPASERVCLSAFGQRLKAAGRGLAESSGGAARLTDGAVRDACHAAATRP